MRCGDLERYLEAFLDGRLGRSRSAVLRRHLSLCAACQGRLERLRQFERDTQRRFRIADRSSSLWEGLELDLVGSGGAIGRARLLIAPRGLAPRPGADVPLVVVDAKRAVEPARSRARVRSRRAASRVAGVALVALALGTVYQMVAGELAPGDDEAALAYLAYRRDSSAPEFRSADPAAAAAWLERRMGHPLPIPQTPAGYRLVGAGEAKLGGGAAGMLLYTRNVTATAPDVLVLLRDRASEAGAAAPVELRTAAVAGLNEVDWGSGAVRYTAVGPRPEEELREFAR